MKKRHDLFEMTEWELYNYIWKARRRRKLRNRFLLLIPSICFILMFTVSYHVIVSAAEKEPQQDTLFKYYTSVMVGYGDSISTIAQDYMDNYNGSFHDYIREVEKINHLDGTEVKAGQYLIVPYFSEEFVYECQN